MAKRLTDTAKLRKPWFRRLSPELKLLWHTLLDEVDLCGVWSVDKEAMDFFLNTTIPWDQALPAFEGRVIEIDHGRKWLIVDFIHFQFGALKADGKNKVHLSVISQLRKHGIDPAPYLAPTVGPTLEPTVAPRVEPTLGPTVGPTPKYKYKEKDKEKDKREGESEREIPEAEMLGACSGPLPSGLVGTKTDPLQWRRLVTEAGGKIYGTDSVANWQGTVDRYGLSEVLSVMRTIAPSEACDPIKVSDACYARQKARRSEKNVAASREKVEKDKAEKEALIARNREARSKMDRVSDYLCDPTTPDEIKQLAEASPHVKNALTALRGREFSWIHLHRVIQDLPELEPIAEGKAPKTDDKVPA